MEGTLIGRAIAEETGAHLVGAPHLGRQAGAGGDTLSRANDAVGAQNADVGIGDVHGAALALAVAGLLGPQLSHHILQVSALGDAVAVSPVGAGNVVIVPQIGACGGGNGFLTDIQVGKAGDLHLCQQPVGFCFKDTDPLHPQVDRLELFVRDRHETTSLFI